MKYFAYLLEVRIFLVKSTAEIYFLSFFNMTNFIFFHLNLFLEMAKPFRTFQSKPRLLIWEWDFEQSSTCRNLIFMSAVLRNIYKTLREASPVPSGGTLGHSGLHTFLQKVLQHLQTNKGYLPCLTLSL